MRHAHPSYIPNSTNFVKFHISIFCVFLLALPRIFKATKPKIEECKNVLK